MKTSKKPKKNPGTRKISPNGSEISKSEPKNPVEKSRFNNDDDDDFDLQLDDDIKGFDEFNDLDEDDY